MKLTLFTHLSIATFFSILAFVSFNYVVWKKEKQHSKTYFDNPAIRKAHKKASLFALLFTLLAFIIAATRAQRPGNAIGYDTILPYRRVIITINRVQRLAVFPPIISAKNFIIEATRIAYIVTAIIFYFYTT